jgi:hypothetical protein
MPVGREGLRRTRVETTKIRVDGAPPEPLRDFYHAQVGLSWPATISVVVGSYFGANAVFAALFVAFGGIANARPGSVRDAFFFSVSRAGRQRYVCECAIDGTWKPKGSRHASSE